MIFLRRIGPSTKPTLSELLSLVKHHIDNPQKWAYGPLMYTRDRNKILIKVFMHFGGASALARELEISRAAVSHWREVPFRHLKRISELTGISRRRLRPDLYE